MAVAAVVLAGVVALPGLAGHTPCGEGKHYKVWETCEVPPPAAPTAHRTRTSGAKGSTFHTRLIVF